MIRVTSATLRSQALVLAGIGTALLTSACGSGSPLGNIVDQIDVKTFSDANGDLWAEMNSVLDTSSFILTGVDIPVIDPHHPERVYGRIAILSTFCSPGKVCMGGGELSIQLNLTQALHSNIVDTKLPNGTFIPVGGLQSTPVVALPIGDTGGRIYMALDEGVALMGVALPFQALDPAGDYVPGANLFFPFHLNNVNGVAGMFFGAQTKQTGIALFVDLSGVINQINDGDSGSSSAGIMAMSSALSSSKVSSHASVSRLSMKTVQPTDAKQNAIYRQLDKLNKKNTHLTLK